MNRRLSGWVRGEIQERVYFKAVVKGFHHEQVNPAYGSQTCPLCGFVDSRNRKGDMFKCLHCEHEDVADRVAAMNYAKR
jgi:transposase